MLGTLAVTALRNILDDALKHEAIAVCHGGSMRLIRNVHGGLTVEIGFPRA